MMQRHYTFILMAVLTLLFPLRGVGRELSMTLDEAITMARVKSVDAAVALAELRSAYWEWRTYRADLMPEVTFKATAPSYSNQYTPYMNEQGEYSFVRNNYLDAQGQIAVTQNLLLTGGKLSLTSSLDFMRMYGEGGGNKFMSIPVALTLTQPIFGVNNLKWQSRIEPVRYAEAKAAFISASEDVALAAVDYFFTLLLSRENLAVAEQNLKNAEKIYKVALEKRRMGRISENDLLQMELNLLDARSTLTDCASTQRSNMFRMRTFLDIEDEDVEIIPVVPSRVPEVEINFSHALESALANNKFAKNLRRRQLEADYEVAKAKGDLRQINLFAQVGYTGTDSQISDAYRRLRGNQVVELGMSIPLLDWGKRRGRVKVAESNRQVTESRLRSEEMNFNQNLFVLIERFGNQQEQLRIASRSYDIALKRYDTNVETFMIGMISTLDLNDSQSRKDESMRQYVNELYRYWSYWYQIRSLTLYDYEHHTGINADIEKLVKM